MRLTRAIIAQSYEQQALPEAWQLIASLPIHYHACPQRPTHG